jgi:hypothetical protein
MKKEATRSSIKGKRTSKEESMMLSMSNLLQVSSLRRQISTLVQTTNVKNFKEFTKTYSKYQMTCQVISH